MPNIMEDDDESRSVPGTGCVICPFKCYENDPENAPTIKLTQKRGIDTCNDYAKRRKMDITFKVCNLIINITIYREVPH